MAAAYAIGTREARATCRICGQPALPAVRLCAQCKAALKRVRHDTVSQLMPMSRRTRGGPRSRRKRRVPILRQEKRRVAAAECPGAGCRAPRRPGRHGGHRRQCGIFHRAANPCGDTGRGADDQRDGGRGKRTHRATVAPVTTADRCDQRGSRPPPAPPATSATAPANTPAATVSPGASRVRPSSAPVGPPPGNACRARAGPAVVAAAPPPHRRRGPLDRMQLLTQAFSQCPQDGALARMVCEQKARIQYCDGYWGQAPLCPNGVPDRGSSH